MANFHKIMNIHYVIRKGIKLLDMSTDGNTLVFVKETPGAQRLMQKIQMRIDSPYSISEMIQWLVAAAPIRPGWNGPQRRVCSRAATSHVDAYPRQNNQKASH